MRPTRKTRRPLVGALLAALALAIATVAGQSQVLAAAGSLGGLTSANLGVDQTDNPDPVLVGQELTYTAVASNAGPDAAPGARLVAKLPAQVDFLSADGPQGPCAHPAKRRVVCVLGELASDSTATVVIGVLPSKAGPIDNVVTVDSRAASSEQHRHRAHQGRGARARSVRGPRRDDRRDRRPRHADGDRQERRDCGLRRKRHGGRA